jgi:hypothetical protein
VVVLYERAEAARVNEAWIEGAGIYAPGLVGWEQAASVLAGRQSYVPTEPPKLAPAPLSADVRRRTTVHIRLAVEVADEAVRNAQVDPAGLWSVFATSESDGAISHNICEEVAKEVPEVSPTRFHNSVTNAPAGYWCMAVRSQAPSTSLSGFDASVGVGLVEAAVQVASEKSSVLLVTHDTPFPEPLQSVRPMIALFGAALVLAPARTARSLARLVVAIEPSLHAPSRLPDAGLEGLRTGNPAARILPLLAALARRESADLYLPYVHSQALRVTLEPV